MTVLCPVPLDTDPSHGDAPYQRGGRGGRPDALAARLIQPESERDQAVSDGTNREQTLPVSTPFAAGQFEFIFLAGRLLLK